MAQLCMVTAFSSSAASRCYKAGSPCTLVSSAFISSRRPTVACPMRRLRVTCSSEPPPPLQDSKVDSSSKPGPASLASLFAVDGAGPETINGRMAMLGFVWALVAEKMTGLRVVDQLFDRSFSGLLWFGAMVLLFTLASLIPFRNGESTDTRRWGPFTGKAELWNGRLAMLGFAALLVNEIVRQAPLLSN